MARRYFHLLRQYAIEDHPSSPSGLQILRRADRDPDRAGADRRGRAERLRQVELLEALRWAMGETSYKCMRGSAMEDVIFAGSQHGLPVTVPR